jgi:hypothetical protein
VVKALGKTIELCVQKERNNGMKKEQCKSLHNAPGGKPKTMTVRVAGAGVDTATAGVRR